MDNQEITAYVATESERQQFDVLYRAFEVFRDRNNVRGDLWKDFDIGDPLHHMAGKLARIRKAMERLDSGAIGKQVFEDEVADDALDVINYAAFIVRHVEKIYP